MADRGKWEPQRRARRRALQALYQWRMTRQPVREILEQFYEFQDFTGVDTALFEELITGVVRGWGQLGDRLSTVLDRPLEQLDLMEHIVLALGAYQLLNRSDVPPHVVLDESIELARRFGAENGHAYVNAVLDRFIRQSDRVQLQGALNQGEV